MKKSLVHFFIFLFFLIVVATFFTIFLQRRWKQELMQYESKGSAEQVDKQELVPVKEEKTEVEELDSAAFLQDEYTKLEELEKDKTWQKDLPLRRRYEKIASLYDGELQRLVSYYGKQLKGTERDNFFAEQSIFLAERNRESKKELSQDKTGVEENVDYLKKYIALTKSRCASILEKMNERE